MTQPQLARAASTSQPTIAKYEAGRAEPRASTMDRILAACGYGLQAVPSPVSTTQIPARGPHGRLLRRHLDEIRTIVHRRGFRNPRVFGSVARGEDTHDSDIDLIVDFGVEDDFLALGPLLEEVQSLLRVRVDLTCPQIAKQAVLEGALRDAIPL